MALTPEQEAEARRLYIESKLTPEERDHAHKLQEARIVMEAAELAFAELQRSCPHPLIAREYKNEGSTGGWDRDSDSFWTRHRCTLCDLRWNTGQRWKYVGGRLGLPDDPEAKE